MHLLRRIVAGLNGQVLEPMKEEDLEEAGSDGRVLDSQGMSVKDGAAGVKRKGEEQTMEGGWEDPEVFARERGEEEDVGEIGDRSNFVAEVSEEPEVHADADADAVHGGVKTVSKEDRKAAKKAKRQAEKREKNEKAKKVKREE